MNAHVDDKIFIIQKIKSENRTFNKRLNCMKYMLSMTLVEFHLELDRIDFSVS